jgi:hypothetical protein
MQRGVKEALKVIEEEKQRMTGTIFLNVLDLHSLPKEIEGLGYVNKVPFSPSSHCVFFFH